MEAGLVIAYMALFGMAVWPIYVGSMRTLAKEKRAKREGEGEGGEEEEEEEPEREEISSADAKQFPLYGSVMLFGLYLLFRYLPKEYINMALAAYFSLLGVASLVALLHPPLSPLLFRLRPRGSSFLLLFSRGKHVLYRNRFDWAHVALGVVSTGVGVFYWTTKHWVANNLFGLAFSVGAIQLLHLDSFRTGCILLAGLFFYDIFWVFGTDVMVSVAKAFDAPVKVVFPRDIFDSSSPLAMLGLGDIVIPGIFVALALRFDQSRAILAHPSRPLSAPFPSIYFRACFSAYCLGLFTTVLVMQLFQAAQPALLYLSPACTLSVIITAYLRGELKELFEYSPGSKNKEKQKEQEKEKENEKGKESEKKQN